MEDHNSKLETARNAVKRLRRTDAWGKIQERLGLTDNDIRIHDDKVEIVVPRSEDVASMRAAFGNIIEENNLGAKVEFVSATDPRNFM